MKSLAQRVKEHRQSLGMTPSDYARHVGTSRQNINNVEAGDAEQPRYIGKLAKAMGTTVDALLGGASAAAPAGALGGTPAYLAELIGAAQRRAAFRRLFFTQPRKKPCAQQTTLLSFTSTHPPTALPGQGCGKG